MLLVCGVFDNHRRISLICLLLGLSWAFSPAGEGVEVCSVCAVVCSWAQRWTRHDLCRVLGWRYHPFPMVAPSPAEGIERVPGAVDWPECCLVPIEMIRCWVNGFYGASVIKRKEHERADVIGSHRLMFKTINHFGVMRWGRAAFGNVLYCWSISLAFSTTQMIKIIPILKFYWSAYLALWFTFLRCLIILNACF